MKIGFSFGKCVRDIARGDVKVDDVLVIVARTRVDREHLAVLVDGYHHERDLYRGLDLDRCKEIAHELWDQGKIHQPRQFGVYTGLVVPDHCVWMELTPTLSSHNPSVIEAWNNYQMLLALAEGRKPKTEDVEKALKGRGGW